MSSAIPMAAVAWLNGWISSNAQLVVVVCAVLLVAAVMLAAALARFRQGWVRELREIVVTLEELRAGQPARNTPPQTGAAASLVFDSIQRLSQDLGVRAGQEQKIEGRLQAVTEAVKDSAIVTTDTDGDVRTFSPGATALLGWDEVDVVSKPAAMLFDEDSFRSFLPKLARRSLRERGVESRAILKRREGETFPAAISVGMLRGSGGEAAGFVLVARDVSAQVALERQLRESEQRYRTLVDGLNEGVLIVRDGTVRYVNRTLADWMGRPAERLTGTRLRDRIATQDVMLVEERLAAVEGESSGSDEFHCSWMLPRPGSRAEMRLNATRVDFEGEPAVLVLLRDESRARRIEAELRHNERQLDSVLESSSDGILVLVETADGTLVKMINRAFAEHLGFDQVALLGLGQAELLKLLDARGGGVAEIGTILAGEGAGDIRKTVTVGGVRPSELELIVTPLVDGEGRRFGRVAACRDLTELRESHRRLQQHAEELQLSKVLLEHSYRKLDAMNQDLESRTVELDTVNQELRKLDEMKSNLLGNVTHELQTPMVSIRGYTEMILKERLGPVSDEQRKGLRLCLRNIDRLISMIDNLLVFTRSGEEREALALTGFPIRGLIEEVVELLREKMNARGVHFELRIEGGEPRILADREKIQQVFINLISNAIKFNRDAGSIVVSVHAAKPGYLEATVDDTGVGISAGHLERIFDRHYQVEQAGADSPQGSGIGLAIVRDLLRLHGCRITVESEEGRGTRFLFNLPADEQRGDGDDREPLEESLERISPAEVASSVEPESTETVAPEAPVDLEPLPSETEASSEVESPDDPQPRFRIIRPGS